MATIRVVFEIEDCTKREAEKWGELIIDACRFEDKVLYLEKIEERKDGPIPAAVPKSNDVVQVLMTEQMARNFETQCLGRDNTVGETSLSPPLLFQEDDVPTYIIQMGGS